LIKSIHSTKILVQYRKKRENKSIPFFVARAFILAPTVLAYSRSSLFCNRRSGSTWAGRDGASSDAAVEAMLEATAVVEAAMESGAIEAMSVETMVSAVAAAAAAVVAATVAVVVVVAVAAMAAVVAAAAAIAGVYIKTLIK
jgi:hypothetical protein